MSTLFWCRGSWHLTNEQLRNLRDVQPRMFRKMLGLKRPPEWSLEDYMIETNSRIKNMKSSYNIPDLDIVAMRNHFAWAGHISRIAAESPTRLSGQMLLFRDRAWLETVERDNNGRQLHCRRFKVWRWERPMVQYAKSVEASSWHELAAEKASCASHCTFCCRV